MKSDSSIINALQGMKKLLIKEIKSLEKEIQRLRKVRQEEESALELQRNKVCHFEDEKIALSGSKKDLETYKRRVSQELFQKNKDLMALKSSTEIEKQNLKKIQLETDEKQKQLQDRITAFENLKRK